MKRSWFRVLLRRRLFVIFLLLMQVICLAVFFHMGHYLSEALRMLITVASFFIVRHVISQKNKGANKVAWVFLILSFPVFGGLFYVLYHYQSSTKHFRKKNVQIRQKNQEFYEMPGDVFEDIAQMIPQHINQVRYLQHFAGFPVYDATRTDYYSPGEKFFPVFLEELKKAQKYIFIEYFIIQEGVLWDAVLDILKEKAAQGVDIRVIYDDIGCFLTLPKDYASQLEQYGIKCAVFNPFRPVLSAIQNNRDHRKITSIDGKVAFTGGLNLADEYINIFEKHGHWKDSVLKVEGKAAWSLTMMFLEMWELCGQESEVIEYFFPCNEEKAEMEWDGFVQPYADSPMDNENVGEHVYIQILNHAKSYVYIATPYLIVDDSMVSALCLAAKSGVDVRIITPHIWDKALIHMTTRSYYRELIHGGVKIYEYSKGFIHSKLFVSDDSTATVGTANLDFRSLYLHFECGVWMYGSKAVLQVKDDFLKTLEQCHLVQPEECKGNLITRLLQDFLRIFAPLL
ncbi:MAG: cardiolipin synthase [bacterium]|nr:cardiolipin synthase [bacterium]MCM1561526.1 cardiolipin synthase [Butyrivibrio sp.]